MRGPSTRNFEAVWEALTERMPADTLPPPDATLTLAMPGADSLAPLPSGDELELGPAEAPSRDLPRLALDDPAGDLEVRELLGEGGMGRVELAVQRSLRREVAVKRARPEGGPVARRLLLRESLFSGYLEHPNIVPVHQLGRCEDDDPVLVMQRIAGDAWRDLLRDPDHPRWATLGGDRLRANLRILMQVCNAVHFAHSRGVLHRDIKPENVMVGSYGEVYLLDWGLALRLDQRSSDSALVGTPAYLAPEMLDGELRVDARTDVYLLGATLHELLTGTHRHPGGTRAALLSAFRSEPARYGPEVPAELAALCNRATHRDPEERPPTAQALREALESFFEHRASVVLSDEARERLDELRELCAGDAPEARRVSALGAQCRFGFEQALRQWPENHAARSGLQQCLELSIEHELAQRNKGVVEALVQALPEPRPGLEARLAALRAELEAEAGSRRRLAQMVQDLDLRVSSRQRAVVLFVWGTLVGVAAMALAVLRREQVVELSLARTLWGKVGLSLLIGCGLLAGRRWFLNTEVNRRISASAVVTLGILLFEHVLAMRLELPIEQVLVLDGLILITMASLFGTLLDKRILIVAIPAMLSVGLSAWWPAYALEVGAVGAFVCFYVAAILWFEWRPAAGRTEGAGTRARSEAP